MVLVMITMTIFANVVQLMYNSEIAVAVAIEFRNEYTARFPNNKHFAIHTLIKPCEFNDALKSSCQSVEKSCRSVAKCCESVEKCCQVVQSVDTAEIFDLSAALLTLARNPQFYERKYNKTVEYTGRGL